MHRTALALLLILSACAAQGSGEGPLSKDQVRARGGKADDGRDYCREFGWYGDGVCDDFCAQRDPDCATDARTPELGGDSSIVTRSRISLGQSLAQAETQNGTTIEAKFELDDAGKLSLSVYPLGKPVALDAERNVFQELAADPTTSPWRPSLDTFHDREHLLRSARDLTLVQLSRLTLRSAVARAERYGRAYWAIPTIQAGRAGYGVYLLDGSQSQYAFIDGQGSYDSDVDDLGTGPGAGATDARVPELGSDVTVVLRSRIRMADAVRRIEAQHGPVIEAKFELDDAGKLSLSIYPVGKGLDRDAERNTFFEAAGDPTVSPWRPSLAEFAVPDEEHLTRSARDLTLVQTASLRLVDAVELAEAVIPGGFVFWAIPTIRATRAGYGIYVLAPDHRVHYLFVS